MKTTNEIRRLLAKHGKDMTQQAITYHARNGLKAAGLSQKVPAPSWNGYIWLYKKGAFEWLINRKGKTCSQSEYNKKYYKKNKKAIIRKRRKK